MSLSQSTHSLVHFGDGETQRDKETQISVCRDNWMHVVAVQSPSLNEADLMDLFCPWYFVTAALCLETLGVLNTVPGPSTTKSASKGQNALVMTPHRPQQVCLSSE